MREKLVLLKKKNWGTLVQSSTYLLFRLVKLDSDVPLETRVAGIVKHPQTGNNDRVQNSKAHADNSVLRQPRRGVLGKTECLDFLIQN